MDIEDLLSMLASGGVQGGTITINGNSGATKTKEDKPFASRADAEKSLRAYLDLPRPDLKVGDAVERNNLGKKKYAHPKKGQASIVVEKFEPRLFGGEETPGAMYDMVVCVAFEQGRFGYYVVDSRYFKKAEEKTAKKPDNIVKLKKRGDDEDDE